MSTILPPSPPASSAPSPSQGSVAVATLERAGLPLRASAALFVALSFGAPLFQLGWEKARGKPIQALDYLLPFEKGPGEQGVAAWSAELGRELIDDGRLRRFETDLHDVSFVTKELLPGYQWLLTAALRHGNEKAIPGRDGWLFFSDDLESAWGRGYLEPGCSGQEALDAIDDFRGQLDARGIELLLVPSYSKELLDAHRLSRFSADRTAAPNPDLERFYAELEQRGLAFVRMDELFAARRDALGDPRAELALPRDTHWSPATMAFCAERIAERARELLLELPPARRPFQTRPHPIEGQGDLLRMLSLPEGQTLYPPMQFEIEQVVDERGELVRPDVKSDVLLMGDSLTKVFSDPALGLGEGAGFAEHLALHLGRPLDVIAKEGGSATATREALARREGDGLAGKKLVIWQFGVRMLAAKPGEWRKVALPKPAPGGGEAGAVAPAVPEGEAELPTIGQPIGTKGKTTDQLRSPDYVPSKKIPRARVKLIGTITAVSPIPPEYDYPFTLCLHEIAVEQIVEGSLPAKAPADKVWVAFPGRVEAEDLTPSRFAPGMRFELLLEDSRLRFDENVPVRMEMNAGRVLHYPLTWRELPK